MCQPRVAAASAAAAAADVEVVTSSGRRRIPAHSSVLASASPVLESILQRRLKKDAAAAAGGGGGKVGRAVVRIRGVPAAAAAAFVRLLYAGSSGDEEEIDEKSAVQLLVLAHAYRVPWLKRRCEEAIGSRLTAETVVDTMQLAGLCDAPQLHLRCTKLLAKEFKAVEKTEAWRFLQENDPWLELDILQLLHDADLRRRRWRRKRAEQGVYVELSEAMGCLTHICEEGCTEVGPVAPPRQLHGVPAHVAAAPPPLRALRPPRRPLQHPSLHVSYTRKEEQKAAAKAGDDDDKWGLLVKKVKVARAMSSLGKRRQMSCSQC
uniref:BTB domain-containing protein n=1 Tax=Oryza brachyantha TaxID=4533 RepID=J3L6Y0_ORYBR